MGTLAITALRWHSANELQRSFAQDVGIALAVAGKLDELVGDALFDVVVTISSPQSDANKFEGNTHDTPSLSVEVMTVKVCGDRHSALPLARSVGARLVSQSPTPAEARAVVGNNSSCAKIRRGAIRR